MRLTAGPTNTHLSQGVTEQRIVVGHRKAPCHIPWTSWEMELESRRLLVTSGCSIPPPRLLFLRKAHIEAGIIVIAHKSLQEEAGIIRDVLRIGNNEKAQLDYHWLELWGMWPGPVGLLMYWEQCTRGGLLLFPNNVAWQTTIHRISIPCLNPPLPKSLLFTHFSYEACLGCL